MEVYKKFRNLGYYAGNLNLLKGHPIAIYCSRKIPLSIYSHSLALLRKLGGDDFILAGGWQSSIERKILKEITKIHTSRVIYFLAKGIKNFKVFNYLKPLQDEKRLLVISPFEDLEYIIIESVQKRDELIKNIIDKFLFLYIDPKGTLKKHFQKIKGDGKSVFILNNPANLPFFDKKVKRFDEFNYVETWDA